LAEPPHQRKYRLLPSLELIRIDASKPAVQFRLVSFPNTWSKSHASKQKGAVSDKGSAYQQFYQTLLDELREKYKFTNAKAAQPQNWFSFRSGVSGITYTSTFATGGVLRAELYIDVGDIIQNKAIFDWLLARKTELEMKMGEPLSWERLDNRRASRISVGRPNSSIDTVAAQGDELRKWLVSQLLKLKSVIGPLLEEAAAAGAMQVSGV